MCDEMMGGGIRFTPQAQSPPSGPQRLTIAPKQPGWRGLADHHDVFVHINCSGPDVTEAFQEA
jgi:hypothetical protein